MQERRADRPDGSAVEDGGQHGGADALLRRGWSAYLVAGAACAVAAWSGSMLTRPKLAGYYAGLAKPSFTPPNWVFPVVWPVLYVLMAVAAGRIAAHAAIGQMRTRALILFGAQLVLNVVWSWAFFTQESPPAGFLTLVFLLAALGATTLVFQRLDRWAAIMLVPSLAWVTYAGVLNGSILSLN